MGREAGKVTSMTLYYDNDGIKIYHGKAEDVLPVIESNSVALSFNDPPYFRVKREYWDRQWRTVEGFLAWLDGLCEQWKRVVKPNGSLFVCASPDRSHGVEDVIKKQFNVLNSIRWIKEDGWHKKADKDAIRSYLSNWEAVIFAEQYGDQYEDASKALHKDVYAPLGRYIQTERERCGMTRSEVEVALGFASKSDPTRGTALCYRWEEGSSLPTKEVYERMRALLNARGNGSGPYLAKSHDEITGQAQYLRREYEDLRQQYEDLRRPFSAVAQHLDTWFYAPVKDYPGKHICEKPIEMLLDIIETTTRPGDVVLDSFCGSGVTLEAAKRLGRKAIGIEVDLKWARRSAARVSQGALFMPPQLERLERVASA